MSLANSGRSPRPLRSVASQRSLGAPIIDSRLSIIAEDADHPPPLPPAPAQPVRTHNRPFSKSWGRPPRPSFENSPPDYTLWDTKGPKVEKLIDVRNNKHIVRRGGWKRLAAVLGISLVIIIGLGVGLGVGLAKKNSSSHAPDPAATSSVPAVFPVGSYALTTYLDSVNTSCTANSATWLCFPYHTYASSVSASQVTFSWIISTSSDSSTNYTVSTADPLSINFADAPLTLRNTGTDSEHYYFAIPLNKYVLPSSPITTDNTLAACWFNNTMLEASLYTKMTPTAPVKATPSSATQPTISFRPWPYAVEVKQSIGGGADVPNCYISVNGQLGARVTSGLTPQPATNDCSCVYRNFNL